MWLYITDFVEALLSIESPSKLAVSHISSVIIAYVLQNDHHMSVIDNAEFRFGQLVGFRLWDSLFNGFTSVDNEGLQ